MLDLHVGPLLGALVVTTRAWNALSPDDQATVTAAAKAFEKSTSSTVPAKDLASVDEMKNRGLTVTQMASSDAAVLYAEIDKLVASMRGDMVPADMYDAAKKARDAYRAKAGAPTNRPLTWRDRHGAACAEEYPPARDGRLDAAADRRGRTAQTRVSYRHPRRGPFALNSRSGRLLGAGDCGTRRKFLTPPPASFARRWSVGHVVTASSAPLSPRCS
jgi:hypothetical protein